VALFALMRQANSKIKTYILMKYLSRDEMIEWLEKQLPANKNVDYTEDLYGNAGGIAMSGEDGAEWKGDVIYDYYADDSFNSHRTFGVLNDWEAELNKRGWWSEWRDAGSVCLWEL